MATDYCIKASIYQYQVLDPDENIHVYAHVQVLAAPETSRLEYLLLKKIFAGFSLFGIGYIPRNTKLTVKSVSVCENLELHQNILKMDYIKKELEYKMCSCILLVQFNIQKLQL